MSRTATYDAIRYDWLLLIAVILLAGFGLSALYSTSLAGITVLPGATAIEPNFANFWKQFWFVVVGLLLTLIAPLFDYRALAKVSRLLIVFSFFLLLTVLLFGTTIRGTTGWFGIAGFGIQPTELIKLFLIIFLAKYFSDYAGKERGLKHVLISVLVLIPIVILIMLQPDFGSALMMIIIWGVLVLASGIQRRHLMVLILTFGITALFAWLVILQPYQKDRVLSFLDPESDPLGRGYNVTQSIIAIGSGGLTGKGVGYGSQSQLRFLPERQTDFIFAVIAEELGFLGVVFLCGLFGVVFWCGYRLLREARDDFTLYLVLGMTVSLAVETFVNLGGNLRLLPVTGVTLPFVSYGGSSLLVKFAMIGLLQSVSMKGRN
jgi:rod shape determining protein RodA